MGAMGAGTSGSLGRGGSSCRGRKTGATDGHVRASKDVVRREIIAAGFTSIENGDELPPLKENYVIRFRR